MILLPSLLIPSFSLPAEMVFSIIPFEKTAIQSLFRLFSNAQCIDSLKAITKYFFVSVDDLLSSDTVLSIAEEDRKQREKRSRTLVFGLLGLQRSAAALSSLRIRSNKTAQAVSVEADVHLFRNQRNRFKTRIALALFNLNDGSSTMFPVLMSAPPIYDAQEIEEYRQKSAEMIEIDGRTLSRYERTQEQRKIETAIRAQKDISNLARAAGLTDEARKASAKIDRLYDRYDQISAAAGLEKQYSRAYVRGYRQTKAGTINAAANNQSTYVKPKIKTSGMTQKSLQKQDEKRIINMEAIPANSEKAQNNLGAAKTESVKMNILDKQIGRKAGKHMAEWGLSPASEDDRNRFIEITKDIQENKDEMRRVEWLFDKETKKRTVEVTAYIKGNDVVLVSDNSEYITTMKDGINIKRVKGGRKIES